MIQTVALTKKLISIPSWVGVDCNEKKLGFFVYKWLRSNTNLTVVKQPVGINRFNVIAFDSEPTKTLLVGHMDTVEPRAGWNTNPFEPCERNGKIFGLGATDMKGSMAAGLSALAESDLKGVMFLAYCDEEYDFAGMRTFVSEYRDKLKPQLIVSLDGTFGQIGIGCRGLIEVKFKIRGKSGHAGRPNLGVNAITTGVNLISKLKRQLANKYSDPILGTTTLNLAYCQGGLDTGTGYGQQGNNIADLAEFVLDIRPAVNTLNSVEVKKLIESYLPGTKLKLEDFSVRHDLGSWLTSPSDLKSLNLKGVYEPSLGYIDTQMLWDAFARVPCCTIGAGSLPLAHAPNEYVEINNLDLTKKSVSQILKLTNKPY